MLAALIIVFREVFEAGLIIGIVMAATQTIQGRGGWIAGGVIAGIVGSCIVAMFAGALSQAFQGAGQELFNAALLGVAVVMLTWHNVWMASHGREMAVKLKATGQAVTEGSKSLAALAFVVYAAVQREGFEVVMFLYGVVATEGASSVLIGGACGLVLGAAVCYLTYRGLLNIPQKYLFGVTGVMIAFLAAGLAAQSVAFLEQANFITALDATIWDSSKLLSESSLPGKALHTLIGYTERPTLMQFVVYLIVLAVMFTLMKVMRPPQRRAAVAAAE